MVKVYHNWRNTQSVSGSGRFCIQNNTNNDGDMSGDFDFCDVTGEGIDLNTGSVAGTITFCLYPCFSKITLPRKQEDVSVFPNPSGGILHIQSTSELAKIEIKNILGKDVYTCHPNAKMMTVDLSDLSPGIYIVVVSGINTILKTEKIIIK